MGSNHRIGIFFRKMDVKNSVSRPKSKDLFVLCSQNIKDYDKLDAVDPEIELRSPDFRQFSGEKIYRTMLAFADGAV